MVRFASCSSRFAVVAICTLAGTAAAPGAAQAAVQSTTYNIASLTVDPSTTSISRNFSVNANQFNPALGTLNSIEIIWSATGTMSATMTGPGGFSWGGGGTTTLNGTGYGSFGLTAQNNSTTVGETITASNTNGNDITLIGGVNTSPASVAAAIGTGTVPIAWVFNGNGGGASLSNWQFTTTGSVTVAYSYTAVPEPVSLSAAAFGALALVRRSRRA